MKNSQKKNPIFVVSTGRSGSTMLARVFQLHKNVCSLHEPPPYLILESFLKWAKRKDQKFIEYRIRTKRERLINQIINNNYVYFESAYFLSHLIIELNQLFDAKFIHIYRDGRNFVRSGLSQKAGYYNRETFISRLKSLIRRRLFINIGYLHLDAQLLPPNYCKSRFEKLAWLWKVMNETIINSFDLLEMNKTFSFPLEKFNKSILLELHEFMGIDVDPVINEKMLYVSASKPRKTMKYEAREALDWSDFEKQKFENIAGKMMKRLGYT